MLLSQIFVIGIRRDGGARDFKFTQCEHIENIEELPFIKRCTNQKLTNKRVCAEHAFTVTHVVGNEGREVTRYFDTRKGAEEFRRLEVPITWIETNYEFL